MTDIITLTYSEQTHQHPQKQNVAHPRSFPFQHKYFDTETNGDVYKYDDLIN